MSGAELSIGLTCLALTTFKPLFRRGFFSSRSRLRSRSRSRSQPEQDASGSSGGIVHYTVDVDVYLEGEGDLEAARKRVEMSEVQELRDLEYSGTSTLVGRDDGDEWGRGGERRSEEKLVDSARLGEGAADTR